MKEGNIRVEQVSKTGLIVNDFDQSLSLHEIFEQIIRLFPNIEENNQSTYYHGVYNGQKYAIRIKNITYLGTPHPHYKKRIQIPSDFHNFYHECNKNGYAVLLLGIYNFNGNIVFCDFNAKDYIAKMAHNSSAHISTNDISKAVRFGYFQKVDAFDNLRNR